LETDPTRVTTKIVGFNNNPMNYPGEPYRGMPGKDKALRHIQSVIHYSFKQPLPLDMKYLKEGKEPRGWKIILTIDGDEQPPIDPSVARFAVLENGKQKFIDALKEAFTSQPDNNPAKQETT
jgi:hypothetical protein